MSNDLPDMHDKANNALVRLLSERLSGVRGGAGHFSPPVEAPTGRPLTPDDAPGVAGQGSDIGGGKSGGVKP